MKPGATITELLLILALLGILTTLAAPQAAHSLDIVAVRAARETVFALTTRTRSTAIAHGGASMLIDSDSNIVSVIDNAGNVIDRADIDADVIVDGATRVVLRYDGFGIGRMTSRTIRIQRGAAQATLTISAYGRVRR